MMQMLGIAIVTFSPLQSEDMLPMTINTITTIAITVRITLDSPLTDKELKMISNII